MKKELFYFALKCFEEDAKRGMFSIPPSAEELEKLKKAYMEGYCRGVEAIAKRLAEEIKEYEDRADNTI